MMRKYVNRIALAVLALSLLAPQLGYARLPKATVVDIVAPLSPAEITSLESLQPSLRSDGTRSWDILNPKDKIKLPEKGDDFLYGLKVTESLEAFYRAVYTKQTTRALGLLDQMEQEETNDLMLYGIALLRVRVLIPMGRTERVKEALEVMARHEMSVFGKNLESAAFRGEMYLWHGNYEDALIHYTRVMLAVGDWRVPTRYMKPPSNLKEIIYHGRAQLRANIGLVGASILQGDYESAVAWAEDAEDRFLDVLGLTKHFIYKKFVKATPDLYTSHGWCLVLLAGARLGLSRNFEANEHLFQKAKEYFAVEGHIDAERAAKNIREYVSLSLELEERPTARIGTLPEPTTQDRGEWPEKLQIPEEEIGEERALSLPELPETLLKIPRAGEKSVYGFVITPEFENAFKEYIQGDGDAALAALGTITNKGAPAFAWAVSFLRAQVLIMMGRAADAEIELEQAAELEIQAFGTNLNARSLRGETRFWLGDHQAAIDDYLQVIQAVGNWRLPTIFIWGPADVSQLSLRSRAQIRAYVGMASALMLQGDYEAALRWASESEELFEDLYHVVAHPIYQYYVDVDPDMVYLRGTNLGIFAAARLALTREVETSNTVFDRAKQYFDGLGYTIGQVTVDAFRVRALLDIGQVELADPLAEQLVTSAVEKGFSDLVWQVEALRGEVLLKQGQKEKAESSFRRAQAAVAEACGSLTTDRSKRRFGIGKEDITRQLVEMDIEKGKWDELFRDLERGRARAFVDMLARQRVSGGGEAQAVDEIRNLDKKIRRQRLLNVSPKGATPQGIKEEKALLDMRRDKVAALRARDPEIAESLSIFTQELADIQKNLEAGEVLAYALPSSAEESIRFLIVDTSSARVETSQISQDALGIALDPFESLLEDDAKDQEKAASGLLQDLGVEGWGATNALYLVPTGNLYFVPWGALETSYPVVVLPTGGWLNRTAKSVAKTKAASVVGDPETGGAFPPLPGAREEATNVSQVYGVTPLVGAGATEEALRKDIGSGVGVLHLATHGFFNDKDPLDSAVILSAGDRPNKLTAAELFENPLPARLVVLSGCETGLGEAVAGDDFLGLARSLYLGGTRAVVYSLWPVPDLPTRQFMEEFHRNAVDGDYGTAWLAARGLLKQAGYPPSVYGAFTLGGQKKGVSEATITSSGTGILPSTP